MRQTFLAVFLALAVGLAGAQTNNRPVAAGAIRTTTSLPATCAVGDAYFKSNATAGANIYACTAANTWTVQGGGTGAALASTHVFVGNGSGVATDVALSGDCTMANTGAITCTKTSGSTFATSATTDTTSATNITSGTLPVARLSLSQITNSLSGNVAVNNTANFFDGPQVAQGSTGTWFASGTITLDDTAGPATWWCKLWDGTTVIASGLIYQPSAGNPITTSLSGYIASPAGNIKISCNDRTSVNGLFLSSGTGLGKDSTVSAFRIN